MARHFKSKFSRRSRRGRYRRLSNVIRASGKVARAAGFRAPKFVRRAARAYTAGRTFYKALNTSANKEGKSHLESLGSCRIVVRRPKKLYKKKGTFSYYQQYASTLSTNSEGKQGVYFMGAWVTYDQFATTPASPDDRYQFKTNIYDLDPYNVWTNTAAYGTQASTINYANRVHWKHSIGSMQVANLSNVAAECTIFWVKNNVTTSSDPATCWLNEIASEGLAAPAAVQRPSLAGTATQGYPNANIYGTTPTYSTSFRKNFKILKKVTFSLGAGENKSLTIRLDINKTYDREFFAHQTVGGSTYMANHTVSAFIIVRPQLVHQTSGVGSASYVTTGISEIAWNFTFKHTFSVLDSHRYDAGLAYPDMITGGVNTSENIINVVDAIATALQA